MLVQRDWGGSTNPQCPYTARLAGSKKLLAKFYLRVSQLASWHSLPAEQLCITVKMTAIKIRVCSGWFDWCDANSSPSCGIGHACCQGVSLGNPSASTADRYRIAGLVRDITLWPAYHNKYSAGLQDPNLYRPHVSHLISASKWKSCAEQTHTHRHTHTHTYIAD